VDPVTQHKKKEKGGGRRCREKKKAGRGEGPVGSERDPPGELFWEVKPLKKEDRRRHYGVSDGGDGNGGNHIVVVRRCIKANTRGGGDMSFMEKVSTQNQKR